MNFRIITWVQELDGRAGHHSQAGSRAAGGRGRGRGDGAGEGWGRGREAEQAGSSTCWAVVHADSAALAPLPRGGDDGDDGGEAAPLFVSMCPCR